MNSKQAKRLFTKYVNNECSAEELELLNKFLDSFQEKGQSWPELKYGSEEGPKKKMWLKVKSEMNKGSKVKRYPFWPYVKYAAVFIVIVGIAALLQYNNSEKPNLIIADEAITLRLNGDEVKEIKTNGGQTFINKEGDVIGVQKGAQLTYSSNTKVRELAYNEILVPNGKKFQLILSDGTFVHLNAGTSLRYPVNFIEGKDRQVFLKGEAYFEVAKDAKHPFVVNANNMGVKVLGTHFNVSSYKIEKSFAVLVEGIVAVYNLQTTEGHTIPSIIRPGQKASLLKSDIEVNNVDINNYLAWRDGNLIFYNESFIDIVEKIERMYNVRIENRYTELNDVKFKGRFKDETIVDLLDVFKESAEFDYQIINNKIIITKP